MHRTENKLEIRKISALAANFLTGAHPLRSLTSCCVWHFSAQKDAPLVVVIATRRDPLIEALIDQACASVEFGEDVVHQVRLLSVVAWYGIWNIAISICVNATGLNDLRRMEMPWTC